MQSIASRSTHNWLAALHASKKRYKLPHVVGQFAAEAQCFAGRGMLEPKQIRVQRLARKNLRAALAAIGGIADQRKSERREVDTDLMRAPRREAAFKHRGTRAECFEAA